MSLRSASLRPALAASASRLVACALFALLHGCASMPGPGEVVTVAVQGPITARDLTSRRDVEAARPALQAAGIGAAEIDAGRVVRVQCAVMSDGWWDSLAVMPEGFEPMDGRASTLEVSDQFTNDRLPVAASRLAVHLSLCPCASTAQRDDVPSRIERDA